MKTTYFNIISLGLLITTGSAYAQNSVTLYGVLDSGIGFVHNSGGKSTQVEEITGMSGPRWGLLGSEDLGGGLSAIFNLENGFSVSNGRFGLANTEFNRSAYVGLSSDRYGKVTLGRQYDPLTDQVQPLTADWVWGGLAATPGDVDNYDDSAWFNNSVKWTSPSWGGLQLETMYSFGGIAGSVSSGQTYSGAAGYKTGPFSLAAGFTHIDNGNPSESTRGTSSGGSLFNSPVNAGYASAKSIDIARVGGDYVAGPWTAGAAYSLSDYNRDGFSTFSQKETYQSGSAFFAYNFTPAWKAGGNYSYTRASGDTSAKYNAFQLGTTYSLSKRTSVYAVGGYVHATGQQRDASGALSAAQAVVGSYDIASGASTQAIAIVGVVHKF
jgi:predicted porin